ASAYAALLLRSGREVIRLRDRPRDLDLDPRLTVVLLYPDVITPDDAAALELGRARYDAGAGTRARDLRCARRCPRCHRPLPLGRPGRPGGRRRDLGARRRQ